MTDDLTLTTDVCDLVGITRRSLDYWVTTGAIAPTRPANGQTRTGYSSDDIERVAAINLVRQDLGELGFEHMPTALVAQLWDLLNGADHATVTKGGVTVFTHRARVPRGLEDR